MRRRVSKILSSDSSRHRFHICNSPLATWNASDPCSLFLLLTHSCQAEKIWLTSEITRCAPSGTWSLLWGRGGSFCCRKVFQSRFWKSMWVERALGSQIRAMIACPSFSPTPIKNESTFFFLTQEYEHLWIIHSPGGDTWVWRPRSLKANGTQSMKITQGILSSVM